MEVLAANIWWLIVQLFYNLQNIFIEGSADINFQNNRSFEKKYNPYF